MRTVCLIFALLGLLLSCQRQGEVRSKIKEAELLREAGQPDSAFAILDKITNPETLDRQTFARFCMLYAELAEELGEDMPFVPQMERADEYFMRHGSKEEKMKSRLYLGMAYEGETDYEWAMKAYLSTAEMAESEGRFTVLGKLYDRIARLHGFNGNYKEAKHYHLLSGEYYLKGNDSVNFICSIRDIGWIEMLEGNNDAAAQTVEKAYRLALTMNDSLVLSSLTNRLGITYTEMGDYAPAEKFLLLSVAYGGTDSTTTYLALADLYTRKGEYPKARAYIEKVPLDGGVLYQSYILEKELGNYGLALDYCERYMSFADSVSLLKDRTNLRKVEKRYESAKLLNRNTVLELRYSRIVAAVVVLSVLLSFGIYVYLKKQKKEKARLKRKQEMATKSLQEKEFELQGLAGKIKDFRKNVLEETDIYRKIMHNARSIEDARKNPLTKEDWQTLYGALKTTYPLFKQEMERMFPGLTEEEKHFCCLLKLGLNNQQLAIFLDILSTSVDRRRYRIRKKGNIENTQTTLEEIITKL